MIYLYCFKEFKNMRFIKSNRKESNNKNSIKYKDYIITWEKQRDEDSEKTTYYVEKPNGEIVEAPISPYEDIYTVKKWIDRGFPEGKSHIMRLEDILED